LKTHGTLDVPEHLQSYISKSESLSWNIENTFSKSKQLVGKKDGARERLVELEKEIKTLENARFKEKPQKTGLIDLMQKADARGRKFTLESGALAYCGKSAADNLALLRQAKAWDYWLHLKDYPGAHAIIHRQRDQEISSSEIQEVAGWVAKESLSSKSLMVGQKVAVVMVECRFVRPIKGDKLGRVTYHGEKTFHFTLR
jgi:predicted ribosome quality control (RQC) complex YloA/Tae2 family protein